MELCVYKLHFCFVIYPSVICPQQTETVLPLLKGVSRCSDKNNDSQMVWNIYYYIMWEI